MVEVINASEELNRLNVKNTEFLINQYSPNKEIEYSIKENITLRSLIDEEECYTLYRLEPAGYAIFYNETNAFMEAVYEDVEWLHILEVNERFYYSGPGNYFYESDGKYHSVISGECLSIEDIEVLSRSEHMVREKSRSVIQQDASRVSPIELRSVVVQEDYFESLTEYAENVDGTCTVIAACILLGYYDVFVNDDFVLDNHRDGSGTNEEFHDYLCSRIYGSNTWGGIFIRDILEGVHVYLERNGLGNMLYSVYSSPSNANAKIKEYLNAGKPVMASMATVYSAPYNHTVVIYGMIYEYNNTSRPVTYYVQTGWHNTRLMSVSESWIYECGYIR